MDVEQALNRGVVEAVVREELAKLLAHGPRPMRVKYGVDPSSADLTLGHVVCFRKLRQLQMLGHTAVVVIGDWTARIGDPTGRKKTRRMLSATEINHNAESYLDQCFRFIDPARTEVCWQSEWFGGFGLQEVIELTSRFTVAQMLERDDFTTRMAAGSPISIAEFLYALFQAYDSIAVEADVELGGNDQLFNVLVGREIMRGYGLAPQHIITVPLLVGTDGVEKMGKSLGNYIAVNETATSMYGKVMSLPDPAMVNYFRLLTDLPEDEYAFLIESQPFAAKQRLAREIVAQFHSAAAANAAEAEFDRVIRERGTPDDAPAFALGAPTPIVDVLMDGGLARSRGEARRLIAQGGVRVGGEVVASADFIVPARAGLLVQVGKRKWLRLSTP
jgi:tyrosyl-tRNA synthetase